MFCPVSLPNWAECLRRLTGFRNFERRLPLAHKTKLLTTFHPLEFFSHCFNLYSIFEYTLYINDFDNLNSSPGCHWHELGEQTGHHKSFQGGNDEMTSEIVEPCIIYWQSQEMDERDDDFRYFNVYILAITRNDSKRLIMIGIL